MSTWCNIHQRDFSKDTDLEGQPLGCCSLCASALMLAAEEGHKLHEKRRVEFTIPQYWILAKAMRMAGITGSHRPYLDYWEAQSLYEAALALPWKSAREFKTRESILSKLEWAKPQRQARTLAEVFGEK